MPARQWRKETREDLTGLVAIAHALIQVLLFEASPEKQQVHNRPVCQDCLFTKHKQFQRGFWGG
jgi:hypothetical protein